jgi:hypothetical protein
VPYPVPDFSPGLRRIYVRDAKRCPSHVILSHKVRLFLQARRCEFSVAFHGGQTNGW